MKNTGNRFLLLALLVVSLALSACTKINSEGVQSAQTAGGVVIEFLGDSYVPNEATIKVGQAVTFENKSQVPMWPASNLHPTHLILPEFDPKGQVEPGQSWSFTFEKVGNFKFHDHLNPKLTGKIMVGE